MARFSVLYRSVVQSQFDVSEEHIASILSSSCRLLAGFLLGLLVGPPKCRALSELQGESAQKTFTKLPFSQNTQHWLERNSIYQHGDWPDRLLKVEELRLCSSLNDYSICFAWSISPIRYSPALPYCEQNGWKTGRGKLESSLEEKA
jgi:hypothetical protein